ncbi:MAG: PAS domain-containing sensor histidine kinase [Actinomycetota bacterium]
MTRRLWVASCVLPLLACGIALAGERAGLYSPPVAFAVLGGLGAVAGASLVAVTAAATSRVREEFARTEEVFRTILDSAPEAVLVTDAQGRVIQMNRQAARLFGYERKEILGRPVEMLLPGRLRDPRSSDRPASAGVAGARDERESRSLSARRKDGREFPAEVILSTSVSGGQTLVTGVIRDVTSRMREEEARKEIERRKAEAYAREREVAERLRALNDMKDAFMRAISHDLRTPLTVILGMTQTLEMRSDSLAPEEARRMLGRIAVNAHKVNHLLSDLMDLNRSMGEALEPHRQATDIGQLVRRVVEGSERKGRAVEIEMESLVAALDVGLTERIVENLVVNAVRHTPDGTPIWVRAKKESAGVLVSVEDAGPGVPDELKEAVFEPFRRVGGALSRAPGMGIGLSLVSQFARLHGGRAWVEDRPGGGASFKVYLPGWPERTRGARVLMVNRSAADQALHGAALRGAGYDLGVCDGPESQAGTHRCPLVDGGLCLLAEGADVIVLNVGLSGDENREVLREYREGFPDTPVVVEASDPGGLEEELGEGCVLAPSSLAPETLIALVDEALSASRAKEAGGRFGERGRSW